MFGFDTSNRSLRQLLSNGLRYSVPRFQRDYSWTETEWDDLWQDIHAVVNERQEQGHYMGYLVLQSADNKQFEVIDGQQRLTTLSLIVLAAISRLEELSDDDKPGQDNKTRAATLHSNFIGFLDPVTLVAKPKLSLNRNNDTFYQDKLATLRIPSSSQGLNASERTLLQAYKWFSQHITERFATEADGSQLAAFVEGIADKFFFTQIVVDDQLNAFKVFETLNARGVRLSATDLLKNYLFSLVAGEGAHDTELNVLERRWETVVGDLGAESFPEFLRVWWNSQHPTTRAHELFRSIRQTIQSRETAFELVNALEDAVPGFLAIKDPDSEYWSEHKKQHKVRRSLRELRMFNVRQPYSLLLAAQRVWADDQFAALAKRCSIIAFRANVINSMSTSTFEGIFNKIARDIHSGMATKVSDIAAQLCQAYASDASFRASFAERQLKTTSARNKKVVRYILHALEKNAGGAEFEFDSERNTIEHILPESNHTEWPNFDSSTHYQYSHRLGNLAILERSLNLKIGDQGFSTKASIYLDSNFKTTQSLGKDYDEWSPERIGQRQQKMAREATSIWRFNP